MTKNNDDRRKAVRVSYMKTLKSCLIIILCLTFFMSAAVLTTEAAGNEPPAVVQNNDENALPEAGGNADPSGGQQQNAPDGNAPDGNTTEESTPPAVPAGVGTPEDTGADSAAPADSIAAAPVDGTGEPNTPDKDTNQKSGDIRLITAVIIAALILTAAAVFCLVYLYSKNVKVKPVSRAVRLTGIGGAAEGSSYTFKGSVSIGRNRFSCEIFLPQDTPDVGGVHCELLSTSAGVMITDLNSGFGTYLADGKKLEPGKPALLKNGDGFSLGNSVNLFTVSWL